VKLKGAPQAAISICGLTKRYGKLTALHNLHLEVKPGEIFGFLGLNGAGKTTTIRILLDLLRATSGRAFIFGHDCQSQGLQARALIGYLPGEMGMYLDLTGREVLNLLAGLGGQQIDPQYRRELLDRLELDEALLRRKVREYSTGTKRKLGLIQAFQVDAPVLILDEPTEGLDPLMQESFYHLLTDVQRRGRTIFMSSHIISEVERVCDRIALLRKGELVLLSTVGELRRLATRSVRISFSEDITTIPAFPSGYQVVEIKSRVWNLKVEGLLGPLLNLLSTLPVMDMEIEAPKLEEVLISYYRDDAA
jgi:ABC-2 type transport system ATP-binding protein